MPCTNDDPGIDEPLREEMWEPVKSGFVGSGSWATWGTGDEKPR
jgi:hypothetical protein